MEQVAVYPIVCIVTDMTFSRNPTPISGADFTNLAPRRVRAISQAHATITHKMATTQILLRNMLANCKARRFVKGVRLQ